MKMPDADNPMVLRKLSHTRKNYVLSIWAAVITAPLVTVLLGALIRLSVFMVGASLGETSREILGWIMALFCIGIFLLSFHIGWNSPLPEDLEEYRKSQRS